jgi:hypothetical protein
LDWRKWQNMKSSENRRRENLSMTYRYLEIRFKHSITSRHPLTFSIPILQIPALSAAL